jgi:hypothetical protein
VKRASAGGLVLSVVVLTGLGLAGSLVPVKTCRSCDGLAHLLLMRTSPSRPPRPPPRIGCPDCTDRGKVSLIGSWMRPKVASSIAALLRGLKDPEGLDARRALDLIVRDSGTAYFDFLKHSPPGMNYFRGAEFVEAEEKLYLLLIADSGSSTIPGSEGLLVILLSAEGRALDFVDVSCSSREGILFSTVFPQDGRIAIHRTCDGPGDRPVSYRILLWNDFDREIRGMGGDVCNVGIRGDRLEVLGK